MGEWSEFLGLAREAAREAGRFLKRGMGEGQEISFKSELDLVTDFDRKSQETIYRRLSEAYPDHGFLAEEGLALRENKEFLWVFDPLDGTTNFAHGLPIFSVSIALVKNGDVPPGATLFKQNLKEVQKKGWHLGERPHVLVGIVYDPMRDEMFEAESGGGARLNGRPIRVSSQTDLNRSLLATGFPYDLRRSGVNNISHFNNFLTRAQALRRCGSAAMDLSYVACGRFDGFWELKLKPWDHAAGALIVREAGGLVTDFSGGAFNVYKVETLASNGLIHRAMIRVLKRGTASARRK